MMEGIASIARGLTDAQRGFLLSLPADGGWRQTTEREMNAYGSNALRGFGKSGLIDGYYQETMRHRLTPFGIQIRRVLDKARAVASQEGL